MKIALIVAMSEDGTIGDQGRIPWHISDDLRRFKKLTMGHAILMGRKTYQSIGKPLPGRTNIVLTRSTDFAPLPEVLTFNSLEAALSHCERDGQQQVFIIGGSQIYQAALPLADQLFLTEVHRRVSGDTKFPALDRDDWSEVAREDGSECSFVEYARRKTRKSPVEPDAPRGV